jgi:hypothetical protein
VTTGCVAELEALNGRAPQIEVACHILHYRAQFVYREKTARVVCAAGFEAW